ncbi:hypothetical protein [Bacillus thuringiensis]|uniref:hypothetical protein n=1 Tax=Bacillus cereus group TaxID=86661 RepID=UPI001EE63FBA|nr:hypothetical protein [Bacillus thuringiensis]MEC3068218.1 hypothetical protein [Bacillus cereus]MEC3093068.1 hypothetical protein [Bacillus cereus]MEC3147860.1 hypothetical protein [Bacillus thuringiensis]MEC3451237.1 hypothetical protein [Bacillus thuringiensis]MEC3503803.1 hypothetical protein [Bacillus thuringiensis]
MVIFSYVVLYLLQLHVIKKKRSRRKRRYNYSDFIEVSLEEDEVIADVPFEAVYL